MSDIRVPDLNVIYIAGRLTRDTDLRYTSSKLAVANNCVANTRYYRRKDGGERGEQTVFIDVTLWNEAAERFGEWGKKGMPVIVEGRLTSNEWEDRETGATRRKLEITATRITPLTWSDDKQTGGGEQSKCREPAQQRQRQSTPPPREDPPEPIYGEEDIPF